MFIDKVCVLSHLKVTGMKHVPDDHHSLVALTILPFFLRPPVQLPGARVEVSDCIQMVHRIVILQRTMPHTPPDRHILTHTHTRYNKRYKMAMARFCVRTHLYMRYVNRAATIYVET